MMKNSDQCFRSQLLPLVFSVLAFCSPAGLPAQGVEKLPRADAVVKPKVYVSVDAVPRGGTFEIAVVAEIMPGFHINTNKPLQDYLIPTTLQAELPAGFKLVGTTYAKGQIRKFEFSEEKLAVYDGSVTLWMKLQAPADAPLGPAKLPIALRYQACSDKACLPPVKLSLSAEFPVAPSGTKPKPVHPEIFAKH